MKRIGSPFTIGTRPASIETSPTRKTSLDIARKHRLDWLIFSIIPVSALSVIVFRLRSLTPNMLKEFLGGMTVVFCALGCLAILLFGVKKGLMGDD